MLLEPGDHEPPIDAQCDARGEWNQSRSQRGYGPTDILGLSPTPYGRAPFFDQAAVLFTPLCGHVRADQPRLDFKHSDTGLSQAKRKQLGDQLKEIGRAAWMARRYQYG